MPANWTIKGGWDSAGVKKKPAKYVKRKRPPSSYSSRTIETQRQIADSHPALTWTQKRCIIKRENFVSFEDAEAEIQRMESENDTEEESRDLMYTNDRILKTKTSGLAMKFFTTTTDVADEPKTTPNIVLPATVAVVAEPALAPTATVVCRMSAKINLNEDSTDSLQYNRGN